MATVSLTTRYLDQLKPQRTRFEVFDTLVPGPVQGPGSAAISMASR
jgi:hypothetical protein